MNDQVVQINSKVGNLPNAYDSFKQYPPACFLGSGQSDSQVESDALNKGVYRLVYITPEKMTSSGFLDRITALYLSDRIALLAIDEAHCTSGIAILIVIVPCIFLSLL